MATAYINGLAVEQQVEEPIKGLRIVFQAITVTGRENDPTYAVFIHCPSSKKNKVSRKELFECRFSARRYYKELIELVFDNLDDILTPTEIENKALENKWASLIKRYKERNAR